MEKLELKSYAKINLSLDVKGLRPDGYHTVETVMQKTSLYDVVALTWDEGPEFSIEITSNKSYLPKDERNLAYKAAVMMGEYAGKKGRLSIDLLKRIPVSAGLAGGSGNAASVLIGLNRIWKLGLDTKALCEMGKKLGSDVPFVVLVQNTHYTCALGTGTGEELSPIDQAIERDLVIAKPQFGVSTKEVYQGIDSVEIPIHPDTEKLISGVKTNDLKAVYESMINVLENYTLKAYPDVLKLKETMLGIGNPEKVMMSGSGPSIMAFYGDKEQAKDACMKLRELGYEAYWLNTMGNRRKK